MPESNQEDTTQNPFLNNRGQTLEDRAMELIQRHSKQKNFFRNKWTYITVAALAAALALGYAAGYYVGSRSTQNKEEPHIIVEQPNLEKNY